MSPSQTNRPRTDVIGRPCNRSKPSCCSTPRDLLRHHLTTVSTSIYRTNFPRRKIPLLRPLFYMGRATIERSNHHSSTATTWKTRIVKTTPAGTGGRFGLRHGRAQAAVFAMTPEPAPAGLPHYHADPPPPRDLPLSHHSLASPP